MTTNLNGLLYIKLALVTPQKAWILFLHGEENYEAMDADADTGSVEANKRVLGRSDRTLAGEAITEGNIHNILLAKLENAY